MPISEVRKCSRLLSPVNNLIDQLHHCVVGIGNCTTVWWVLVIALLCGVLILHFLGIDHFNIFLENLCFY